MVTKLILNKVWLILINEIEDKFSKRIEKNIYIFSLLIIIRELKLKF